MEHNDNHIEELIAKVLANEASMLERDQVEKWRNSSDANRKHFEHLKVIFGRAAAFTESDFDADVAWINLKKKLSAKNVTKTVKLHDRGVRYYLRIAASILFLCIFSFIIYRFSQKEKQTVEVIASSETLADTLPDGTNVVLNKQTKLTYQLDKRKGTRKVKLTGEAYFAIQPDVQNNFIVETDEISIRDIGTKFNVKAYPDLKKTEVNVEEGEVILYNRFDSVHVIAGQKGLYDKATKSFSVLVASANSTAYKTKTFIFNSTQLDQVVKDLNAVYNKQIVLDSALSGCRVTVSFNDESIDDISEVIAETLGLTLEKQGGKIILKGSGCEN